VRAAAAAIAALLAVFVSVLVDRFLSPAQSRKSGPGILEIVRHHANFGAIDCFICVVVFVVGIDFFFVLLVCLGPGVRS
jgi:hypothetical protein